MSISQFLLKYELVNLDQSGLMQNCYKLNLITNQNALVDVSSF